MAEIGAELPNSFKQNSPSPEAVTKVQSAEARHPGLLMRAWNGLAKALGAVGERSVANNSVGNELGKQDGPLPR